MKATKFSAILLGLALAVAALAQGTIDQATHDRMMSAIGTYRSGNVADATATFEDLYQKFPENADVQAWLGFLYLRGDQPDKAVPVLEKAAAARPKDLEVAINLGNAYMGARQSDKAVRQYQMVSQMDAKMFEPHYNIGNIYLQSRDYPKAIESYRLAAALKSDDPFIQNNLGVASEGAKDYEAAAAAFMRASDMRRDNKTFARNAGFALMRLKRNAEAVTYLERAHSLDANDAAVSMALAQHYSAGNKRDDALKHYNAIESRMNSSAAYWFNLGVLRSQSGDNAGAEAAYRKALEINPNDLDSLNNLGLLLYNQGKYREAMTTFDKLRGLDANSRAARLNYAASAAKSGDMNVAIESWTEFVRTAPARNDVRISLANALWARGEKDKARFHYNQALLVDPKSSEAHNGIGLAHLQENRLAPAETSFRSAIAGNAKNVAAYNNLAITLERMNRRKQAIALLERALQIDSGNADVRKNLERMKAAGP